MEAADVVLNSSVLVVEDEPGARGVLVDNLAADSFSVLPAPSAEEALDVLVQVRPDAAVIDIGLPGMSGLDLVTVIRESDVAGRWDPDMPILLVSGRRDQHGPVRGLARGADDYLVKPYHYPELLGRLSAALRRARGGSLVAAIRVGPLHIDRRARMVSFDGDQVALSAKELGLLIALARDPHRLVTKQELMRDVWGYRGHPRTRTVDCHASRLRRKLRGMPGAEHWVENVWGVGYRLLPSDA